MIDPSLIEDLSADPDIAAAEFCERIIRGTSGTLDYDALATIALLGYFQSYCDRLGVKLPEFPYILEASVGGKNNIISYFKEIIPNLKLNAAVKQTQILIESKTLKLTDKTKVAQLIERCRAIIQESAAIPEEHRAILLSKLDSFLIELERPTPNLDLLIMKLYKITIWLKDTGEAAKPFLEPITEILKLLNKINPDGALPIGSSFLGLPSGDDD